MTGLALDVQRTHALVMAKTTKAPGRNISDAERNTDKVTLRLDPALAEDLRMFADEHGVPMSRVVEAAMMMVWRVIDAADGDEEGPEAALYEEFKGDLDEAVDLGLDEPSTEDRSEDG